MPNLSLAQGCSIVLVEPSHPGNIGAVARAMKTMGFSRLVLVNPKRFPHEDATALASGATDLLDNAVVVADLPTALKDSRWVVGVSARLRDVPMPCMTPRMFASQPHQDKHFPIAIVFGNEQSGLSNDDLAHCHQQMKIPTAGDYGSLNLAQAVQIVCYELSQASEMLETMDEHQPATQQDFEGMFAHWCEVLEVSQVLHPQQRQKMLIRMRQLWLRAEPSPIEITMLRGAFRNILRHILSKV